jgi:hypothetical protein
VRGDGAERVRAHRGERPDFEYKGVLKIGVSEQQEKDTETLIFASVAAFTATSHEQVLR